MAGQSTGLNRPILQYAVGKAMRRGLKMLPEPLTQFLPQAA
jgi:hypothetical protein